MSHFTVLVIGKNPEKKLEPFNEQIEVDEYEVGKVSDEDLARFMEHYKENDENFVDDFDAMYERRGDDWNGSRWRKDGDGVWREYSTYNPKSKWDWCSLGGRWSGFFKLKKGCKGTIGEPGAFDNKPRAGYTDQCKVGDIDFESMSKEAAENAAVEYDKVHAVVAGRKIPVWKEYIKKYKDDIPLARKKYGDHPVMKSLAKAGLLQGFGDDVEDYACSREEFIEIARLSSVSTFALVDDNGEWHEKGKMGWFGMSQDAMTELEWLRFYHSKLASLAPDTLVSVIDCHI